MGFASGGWWTASAIADETEPTAAEAVDGEDAAERSVADDVEPESDIDEAHAGVGHDGPDTSLGASHEGEHGGEHGDAAAHDPYDLSHANASKMLDDPTEWRYDMALCTFVVFLLLLLLLRAFAWRPIMSGLVRRESAIVARIDEAERDAAEAAAQLQAYRDKLASAAQEAQEIVNRARRDAEAVADKIRNAASEDAVRERQRALADIESAKKVALREVAEKGAEMAVGLAGRIVRRELNPQDHAELIRESLGQFPSNN